jgi:hypothetical protein
MNMKLSAIKAPPIGFQPVTISITCHTLDELRLLWAMANAPDANLMMQGEYPNIAAAVKAHTTAKDGANAQLFRFINAALIEANGKD